MIQFSAHMVQITTPKTTNSYRTIHISSTLLQIQKKQQLLQKERKLLLGNKYHDSNFVCTKLNGKPISPNSINTVLLNIVNM